MESVLAIAGLALVLLGSVAVFLLRTWRWALAAFAVQSLGMGSGGADHRRPADCSG